MSINMATPGVLWSPSKEALEAAIRKHHGIITRAATEFKVNRHSLKRKIDLYPDLVELLQNLREDFENTLLDLAEDVVILTMKNIQKDPANALKSSMFVLNSKGRKRNWNNTLADGVPQEHLEESFCALMNQMKTSQSFDLKNADSQNINDNMS